MREREKFVDEVPTEIMQVLDCLEETPGLQLRWLKMQTQVWVRGIRVGGYNRRNRHFYLLIGAVDELGRQNIQKNGFEFKTKSSGHRWWQAPPNRAKEFLGAVLQLNGTVNH